MPKINTGLLLGGTGVMLGGTVVGVVLAMTPDKAEMKVSSADRALRANASEAMVRAPGIRVSGQF